MNSAEELYTIFPVFMLVDVSASMSGGPIEAVNAALPDLKREMLSNPTVGEIARVCVITFSDEGRVAVPLCDLAYANFPEIMVEAGTLRRRLRVTCQAIEEDGLRAPPRAPTVLPSHERWSSHGTRGLVSRWLRPGQVAKVCSPNRRLRVR